MRASRVKATTHEPLLLRQPNGTISLSFDDGDNWVTFRTEAHFAACLEHIDRIEAARVDVAAYHERVQALRTERDTIG